MVKKSLFAGLLTTLLIGSVYAESEYPTAGTATDPSPGGVQYDQWQGSGNRDAGSASDRTSGSASDRDAGSAADRTSGSASDRDAGAAQNRTPGSASDRNQPTTNNPDSGVTVTPLPSGGAEGPLPSSSQSLRNNQPGSEPGQPGEANPPQFNDQQPAMPPSERELPQGGAGAGQTIPPTGMKDLNRPTGAYTPPVSND